jgi:phosphoenolpyruvate---glycerone phosphotransferase subunit DhaL
MEIIVEKTEIASTDLLFALEHASLDMVQRKDMLGELDATIGDGDLGVTIELGCRSLQSGLRNPKECDIGAILVESGQNFSRAASSTFGILVATAFMRAGREVGGRAAIGLSDLVRMGKAVSEGIQSRGNARLGDKTILDAIIPAVQVLEKAEEEGRGLGEALDWAVLAAKDGMESTIPLKSRYGRAAWLSEKSVGVRDPGATAVCLFLESFVRHLNARLA